MSRLRMTLRAAAIALTLAAAALCGPFWAQQSGTGRSASAPPGAAGTPAITAPEAPGAASPPAEAAGPSAAPGTAEATGPAAPPPPGVAACVDTAWEMLATRSGSLPKLVKAEAQIASCLATLGPADAIEDEAERTVLARALAARGWANLDRRKTKAAEEDFAAAVRADPAFVPADGAMPRKTADAFARVRAGLVGFVKVLADPNRTRLSWNGRPMRSGASGEEVAVLAGPFVLVGTDPCAEERRLEGTVAAAEHQSLTLRLEPLGRDLLFVTRPAGFQVVFDGKTVGTTAPPQDTGSGEGSEPGEADEGRFLLACVPAGEHEWSVFRECREPAQGKVSVTVDLLDWSAQELPAVVARKVESTLSVTSDVAGTRLFVDDLDRGPLPAAAIALCPGSRRIEVRLRERAIWSATQNLKEGPLAIDAVRRPSLRVLVAPAGAWTPEGEPERTAFAARVRTVATFNQLGPIEPRLEAELLAAPQAAQIALLAKRADPQSDLILKLVPDPAEPSGGFLATFVAAASGIADEARCRWADDACLDRVIDGLSRPVAPSIGEPARIMPPGRAPTTAARLAAIAGLDAAVLPPGETRNASALDLAMALVAKGRCDQALDLALEGSGLSESVKGAAALGTVRYLSGLCYELLGRREQAFAALRKASMDPDATLWDPDGVPVAPLARLALAALAAP